MALVMRPVNGRLMARQRGRTNDASRGARVRSCVQFGVAAAGCGLDPWASTFCAVAAVYIGSSPPGVLRIMWVQTSADTADCWGTED